MDEGTGVILTVPFRIVDKGAVVSDFNKAPDEEGESTYAFATAQGALEMTEQIASTGAVCTNFHGHVGPEGETIFMPCSSHDEMLTAITEMDSYEEAKVLEQENGIQKDALELGDAPEIDIGKGVLIEGPVSSGVTDRDGDVVEPEAVMSAWEGYKSNPIILHNHERGGIGRMIDVRMGEWEGIDHPVPIGRALIDESEKSIVNKIRKGIIRAFSIGFIGKEGGIERIETDSGGVAYRFKDIDWVETSVVDIPSNPVALFDVVKNKEGVLVKSTAPVSFNSPFAIRIFQQESKTMTDEELEQTETTEVEETSEEVVEEPALEEVETKFVSEEEFKSLESKVNDILEGMMALKEMSTEPEPVDEEESSELVALKAEVASLREEKAAAELEARIASEVEARVKSIVGDKPAVERKPERKSMAGANIKINESDFETVAQERGVSVGAVKGEAWLASLLTSRRN